MCQLEKFKKRKFKRQLVQATRVFNIALNDANYPICYEKNGQRFRCPYYQYWYSMLRRCLDPQARLNRPDYIGSAVCAPWLVFSNFKRWMVRQNWENRSLDKDLLIPGNKLYSPKTCIFIPNYINNTLLKRVPRQHLPGVHIETTSGRYVAQCQMTNLETGQRFTKKIGRFKTEKQAYKAYVSFKSQLIYTLAEPYKTDEPKLYKSLLRYSKDLYSGKLTKYYKGQQVNLSLAKLKNTPEI